jgi:DNA-binding transcriptional regulator YdaS (Cro superfamily)
MTPEQALANALKIAGGRRALGRLIKVSGQAIANWRTVPAERVLAVERAVGIRRELLRPDIYPPEDKKIARRL